MIDRFRIGTRGSRLALAQTDMVMAAIKHRHASVTVESVVIQTTGDWKPSHGETRLSEKQGGKGLFAKEIEQELLNDNIDGGVHSLKDLPSFLPPGLDLAAVLNRADSRDAFLSEKFESFEALPPGSVIGTASLRRQSYILRRRPDLKVVTLRGNVPTRIEKMKSGQVDAIMLAAAGLNRLGLGHEIRHHFAVDDFVPACGQGVVAIETRVADTAANDMLASINARETWLCILAERAALQALDGSCQTPVGSHATLENGVMTLHCDITDIDGSKTWAEKETATVKTDLDAINLGRDIGMRLKPVVPSRLLLPDL